MREDVIRKMLALVNNKQNVDRLSAYAEDRANYLNRQLEQCATFEEMKVLQGQLKEVRRLETLHEEVNQLAKDLL